jgi:hypothetical protein
MVSAGDGFLGNLLEDLDDGSVGGAHDDGRAFGDEALGTERREMVANQLEQSFLAAGARFVASY